MSLFGLPVRSNPALPDGWILLVGTIDHVFCKHDEDPPRFFKWDGERLQEVPRGA